MADITIVAASVKLVSGQTESILAGATVTAGQVGYKDTALKARLSDNDGAAELRFVRGMMLNNAAADQPVVLALDGAIVNVGAVLTAGTDYYLSGTPGSICPRADVTTGDEVVRIGMALTTSNLQLDILKSGVTL